MRACHSLKRLHTGFDDPRLVADAGLLLPATLATGLGLGELLDARVQLGGAAGGAHVGRKALTVIASVLAGGDCIEDAEALRAGGTGVVLGQAVPAPSTLGTFLRSFSYGHVRQLDAVSREALARAWAAGAGPGEGALTIDLDSTLCQTYGRAKAGARERNYLGQRGYHPLLAVAGGSGEVLHSRLRGGRAAAGRGAGSFVRETLARVRAAGATGPLYLRADAGFYTHAVVQACRQAGARCSITVRLNPTLHRVIAALPPRAWQPLPGWTEGQAAVAATPYTLVGQKGKPPLPLRLVVRRVEAPAEAQLRLLPGYRYHAFITNRPGDALRLEALHRRHAEVEPTICELKHGLGLNHFPSGRFGANGAWLALNALAHNLLRWLDQLALGSLRLSAKRLRYRFLRLPGRLTRSARRRWLHLPATWPWAPAFLAALARLRALPPPAPA